jgi:hypothetical protein
MSFEAAGQQYARLRQQRDMGQISDAQFRQAVGQLLVTDNHGVWWWMDADTGQWQAMNAAQAAAAAPSYAAPAPQPYGAQPYGQQQAYPPQAAPQYGAPYGQQALPAEQEKTHWGQKVWDVISVAGSAVMSGVWYWYSGMAETKADYKTCAAMVVLPILLIVFRKPLDKVLRPLEPFRKKIPSMVLAGCGVAIPLLVSNYLYSRGETQFPFMFKTYVYSTVLSYIVLRTPSGGRLPSGFPQGGNI